MLDLRINFNKERFAYEDEGYDFPFYNDIPMLTITRTLTFILCYFIGFIFFIINDESIILNILSIIIFMMPLFYYCKDNITSFIRKISMDDLKLVLLLSIGYIMYAIIMLVILELIGFTGDTSSAIDIAINLKFLIVFIISIFIEELIKYIPFIILLTISFKMIKNRKTAIILTSIVVMLFFGLLHMETLNDLIYVVLIQGLGSIFEFYGFIKTKNILVPYATHLISDLLLLLLSIMI